MITLGRFSVDYILFLADLGYSKAKLEVDDNTYNVKICESQRIRLFAESADCAHCDRKGSYFLLQKHRPDIGAHLNLYSEDDVLMTKDHIIPKSKGGKNHMSNYQTMCYECNQEKRDEYEG